MGNDYRRFYPEIEPLFIDSQGLAWYDLFYTKSRYEAEVRCKENGMKLPTRGQIRDAGENVLTSLLDNYGYPTQYSINYGWINNILPYGTDLDSTTAYISPVFGPDLTTKSHHQAYSDREPLVYNSYELGKDPLFLNSDEVNRSIKALCVMPVLEQGPSFTQEDSILKGHRDFLYYDTFKKE